MGPSTAHRVEHISPPIVAQILSQAEAMEEEGHRLIYLLRGEPDFETPAHIAEAAINAIEAGETHYPPMPGIPNLRKAVAERMVRDFDINLDSESEVLITTGATMGLYAAVMAVVNPGDEVLLFDPVYDPYPTVVRMAGGVPIKLAAEESNGHFIVSQQTIREAISDRCRAILINNPWNPTGTVMAPDELMGLVGLAEEHDLMLISDEIYEMIVFDGLQHFCVAALSSHARARTITVNSFSKTYAMTGWRLGYNLANAELVEAMALISAQFSRSASTFVQIAGVEALNGPQGPSERMVQAYVGRRALIAGILEDAGIHHFHLPEGTFFFFLDIRPFGMNSLEAARYLMQTAHVVTVPGSAYGPAGEGFLRLSFAYSEETIEAGAQAVAIALRALA